MQKALSFIVLAALVAGIALGAGLKGGDSGLINAAQQFAAIGNVWLDALRMTIMPLIFALMVTSVASTASVASSGKLAVNATLLFSVLLVFAGVFGIAAAKIALALWPLDPAAAQAFVANHPAPHIEASQPGFGQFVRSLMTDNPIRAAAEDSVLQVVVFALFFGFAAASIEAKLRDAIVTFFTAVNEVMIKIIHWVLIAAPLGVFALALNVGLSAGWDAAETLVHYIIIVAGCIAVVTLVAALIAIVFGGLSPAKLVSGMIPVWSIAASSQSSLASLPAMLEASHGPLGLSRRVADFTLPLAVAVFRFTSPVGNLAVCYFVAALYGIEPDMAHMAAAIFVAFAMSVSAVGLPGQVSFITSIAPIALSLGLPVDILGVLIAVEVFPDIWRTLGNVTGDIAATAILSKRET